MSGHESPRHADLIRRVLAANAGTQVGGFNRSLIRHLVAESGDVTLGEYVEEIGDPYAMTGSDFTRRYLNTALRYVIDRAGMNAIPDAYQFDDRWMTVVAWEVSVSNNAARSVEKWLPLAIEIDGYDPWTLAVVSVDAGGVCSCNVADAKPVTWLVDEPCPIDWTKGVTFTDRGRLGGLEQALRKRLARIRLDADRGAIEDEESAAAQ